MKASMIDSLIQYLIKRHPHEFARFIKSIVKKFMLTEPSADALIAADYSSLNKFSRIVDRRGENTLLNEEFTNLVLPLYQGYFASRAQAAPASINKDNTITGFDPCDAIAQIRDDVIKALGHAVTSLAALDDPGGTRQRFRQQLQFQISF